MPGTFTERWYRGMGLSIVCAFFLGVVWAIPNGNIRVVGESKAAEIVPQWMLAILGMCWAILMLVLCTVAFDWLAFKAGLPRGESDREAMLRGRNPEQAAGE